MSFFFYCISCLSPAPTLSLSLCVCVCVCVCVRARLVLLIHALIPNSPYGTSYLAKSCSANSCQHWKKKRHHVNSCPIYPLLLTKSFSWLPPATKARLLEWKIRLDLIQYVARGAPELALPSVHKPLPAREALEKLHALEDDGHAIKLGRAMEVFGKLAPGPGRGGGGVGNCHDKIGWTRHFDVAGTEGVWEGLLGMVVESTGRKGEGRWVRSVGMEEAWKVSILVVFVVPFPVGKQEQAFDVC